MIPGRCLALLLLLSAHSGSPLPPRLALSYRRLHHPPLLHSCFLATRSLAKTCGTPALPAPPPAALHLQPCETGLRDRGI